MTLPAMHDSSCVAASEQQNQNRRAGLKCRPQKVLPSPPSVIITKVCSGLLLWIAACLLAAGFSFWIGVIPRVIATFEQVAPVRDLRCDKVSLWTTSYDPSIVMACPLGFITKYWCCTGLLADLWCDAPHATIEVGQYRLSWDRVRADAGLPPEHTDGSRPHWFYFSMVVVTAFTFTAVFALIGEDFKLVSYIVWATIFALAITPLVWQYAPSPFSPVIGSFTHLNFLHAFSNVTLIAIGWTRFSRPAFWFGVVLVCMFYTPLSWHPQFLSGSSAFAYAVLHPTFMAVYDNFVISTVLLLGVLATDERVAHTAHLLGGCVGILWTCSGAVPIEFSPVDLSVYPEFIGMAGVLTIAVKYEGLDMFVSVSSSPDLSAPLLWSRAVSGRYKAIHQRFHYRLAARRCVSNSPGMVDFHWVRALPHQTLSSDWISEMGDLVGSEAGRDFAALATITLGLVHDIQVAESGLAVLAAIARVAATYRLSKFDQLPTALSVLTRQLHAIADLATVDFTPEYFSLSGEAGVEFLGRLEMVATLVKRTAGIGVLATLLGPHVVTYAPRLADAFAATWASLGVLTDAKKVFGVVKMIVPAIAYLTGYGDLRSLEFAADPVAAAILRLERAIIVATDSPVQLSANMLDVALNMARSALLRQPTGSPALGALVKVITEGEAVAIDVRHKIGGTPAVGVAICGNPGIGKSNCARTLATLIVCSEKPGKKPEEVVVGLVASAGQKHDDNLTRCTEAVIMDDPFKAAQPSEQVKAAQSAMEFAEAGVPLNKADLVSKGAVMTPVVVIMTTNTPLGHLVSDKVLASPAALSRRYPIMVRSDQPAEEYVVGGRVEFGRVRWKIYQFNPASTAPGGYEVVADGLTRDEMLLRTTRLALDYRRRNEVGDAARSYAEVERLLALVEHSPSPPAQVDGDRIPETQVSGPQFETTSGQTHVSPLWWLYGWFIWFVQVSSVAWLVFQARRRWLALRNTIEFRAVELYVQDGYRTGGVWQAVSHFCTVVAGLVILYNYKRAGLDTRREERGFLCALAFCEAKEFWRKYGRVIQFMLGGVAAAAFIRSLWPKNAAEHHTSKKRLQTNGGVLSHNRSPGLERFTKSLLAMRYPARGDQIGMWTNAIVVGPSVVMTNYHSWYTSPADEPDLEVLRAGGKAQSTSQVVPSMVGIIPSKDVVLVVSPS